MGKITVPCKISKRLKINSFVPGPSNYVSTIADTLATGFNVFSGGWVASPAAAELESTLLEKNTRFDSISNERVGEGFGIYGFAKTVAKEGFDQWLHFVGKEMMNGD